MSKVLEKINWDYKFLKNYNSYKDFSYLEFMKKRKDRNLYLNEDIEEIVHYCKENFKYDIKEVLKIANEVLNKTFLFNCKWDMERTYIPVIFESEINWEEIPFDDIEWVYMINRHKFWCILGQAYALTGKEKYADTFFYQLNHWIDNNPLNDENKRTSWRTIEAGIRCENWIKSFSYFKNSKGFTEELLEKFIESLIEHGKYLYETYTPWSKLTNWGVLEAHGLFILGIFLPEMKYSQKYIKTSLKRLEEQLEYQVMKDGIHWEQSPMYHNEVLHCYIDSLILARKNNIKFSKETLKKIEDFTLANLYMAKPNHHQVTQGDSDDTDIRDMLVKGAYLFNNGMMKYGAFNEMDFESIWDLGIEAVEKYKNIKKIFPGKISYAFDHSGNYYMRSGWDEDDNYMYFHCGTLGSGHGHCDLLHINLFGYGEDFLVDSGRYTYVEGNKYRKYFKECKAHNTTLVDNIDFSEVSSSWTYKNFAMAVKQPYIFTKHIDYVEGGHLGYMNIKNGGAFTNRKIIYIKPSIWVIVDEFYGEGKHNYKQYFHFDSNKEILKNDKIICIGEKGKLEIIHIDSNVEKSIINTKLSKHYNHMEENKTLVTSVNGEGFKSIITVLGLYKNNEGVNIDVEKVQVKNYGGGMLKDYEGEAIKIIFEDEVYIVIVIHNITCNGCKLLEVDGKYIYGKVVVIKEKAGEELYKEVLKY